MASEGRHVRVRTSRAFHAPFLVRAIERSSFTRYARFTCGFRIGARWALLAALSLRIQEPTWAYYWLALVDGGVVERASTTGLAQFSCWVESIAGWAGARLAFLRNRIIKITLRAYDCIYDALPTVQVVAWSRRTVFASFRGDVVVTVRGTSLACICLEI